MTEPTDKELMDWAITNKRVDILVEHKWGFKLSPGQANIVRKIAFMECKQQGGKKINPKKVKKIYGDYNKMIDIKSIIQKHRNKVEEYKAIKNENRRLDIAIERRKLEESNTIQKEKDMLRTIKTKQREIKQKEFKEKIGTIKRIAQKFEIKDIPQTPKIKDSKVKKITSKQKETQLINNKDNPFLKKDKKKDVWGFN